MRFQLISPKAICRYSFILILLILSTSVWGADLDQYYKTVQKSIHAGTKVDPSYTPKQIESVLKQNGDQSISELTSLYESVRYSEKKD